MLVLSIESSCDETSLAILDGNLDDNQGFYQKINSFKVLASIISSQIEVHKQYGGVVPEVGARKHAEQIHFLFLDLLKQASSTPAPSEGSIYEVNLGILDQIDYIFVTSEPGLTSALRVGQEFAKALSFFIQKKTDKKIPIKEINHLKGHVASCFFQKTPPPNNFEKSVFPHLHLLVSGGNTQLILLKSWEDWEIVGQTLDDAGGESFDKIARMLGFPYPGGIHLAKTAGLTKDNPFNFPISMQNDKLDFSFSGLKTSVRYFTQKQNIQDYKFESKLTNEEVQILERSSQEGYKSIVEKTPKLKFIKQASISTQTVIITQLMNKLKLATSKFNPSSIGISGGVSANQLLQEELLKFGEKQKIQVLIPGKELTGDNAIMIGLCGVLDLNIT